MSRNRSKQRAKTRKLLNDIKKGEHERNLEKPTHKESYGYERKTKRKLLVDIGVIDQHTGKATTRQVTVERWKKSALVTRRGKTGKPNVRAETTLKDKIVLSGGDAAMEYAGKVQTSRSRSGKVSRKLVRIKPGQRKAHSLDQDKLVETPSVAKPNISSEFQATLDQANMLKSLPGITKRKPRK